MTVETTYHTVKFTDLTPEDKIDLIGGTAHISASNGSDTVAATFEVNSIAEDENRVTIYGYGENPTKVDWDPKAAAATVTLMRRN